MTQILADHLRDLGHQVCIAFPATRSHRPELNALPLFGKPSVRYETAFNGHECVAVGTYFPELEYTYSKPSRLWQSLIESHDFHVVVSGTSVMATPLAEARIPHLVWCASDVYGDRIDRQMTYALTRRLLDRYLVMPRLQSQERQVLSGNGRVMTISRSSKQCLVERSGPQRRDIGQLNIPTDMDFFCPPKNHAPGWRLGFAGRLPDPRKNAALLLDVVARLHQSRKDVSLTVTGEATPELTAEIATRGLEEAVIFLGVLDQSGLRDFYQNLGVFVIPSFQEGHAIVGVEAMACGVPVVSTRCGGPEDYVKNQENGYLCDFDVEDMVACIESICGPLENRTNMSLKARKAVVEKFGLPQFHLDLKQVWYETFANAL